MTPKNSLDDEFDTSLLLDKTCGDFYANFAIQITQFIQKCPARGSAPRNQFQSTNLPRSSRRPGATSRAQRGRARLPRLRQRLPSVPSAKLLAMHRACILCTHHRNFALPLARVNSLPRGIFGHGDLQPPARAESVAVQPLRLRPLALSRAQTLLRRETKGHGSGRSQSAVSQICQGKPSLSRTIAHNQPHPLPSRLIAQHRRPRDASCPATIRGWRRTLTKRRSAR